MTRDPRPFIGFALTLTLTLAIGLAGPVAAGPVPGDRGHTLTVIRGETIESIPLEYVGILDDFAGPGRDLHLVRLEGPVADHVGVAAGISGSPVWIGDALLGALSYRMGALPRDAIAGVTPLDDVLAARRAPAGAAPRTGRLAPIAVPIQASGLAAPVREWLAPQLDARGLVLESLAAAPVSSPTGPPDPLAEPRPLTPGSPVAISLIRGDSTVAASGTVTWVEDGDVYAFGHPFFGSGRTAMPMHHAAVVHTLADQLGSTKITRMGDEIGAIVEDRLTAVVGRTGAEAEMLPVRVRVRGADYGEQAFRFEVVRDSPLTALLAGTSVANALLGNPGYGDKATMRVHGQVGLRDLPELPIEMTVAGESPSAHGLAVAVQLLQLLTALRENAYGEAPIENIELEVEVSPRFAPYTLESLVYDRGGVRPGQQLRIGCVLREFRGERTTEELVLRIPENLAPGTDLRVAVGPPERLDVALGRPAARRAQTADSLASFVRALGERRGAHRLSAVLYEVTSGVVARGETYSDLPPSAARLLSSRAAVTGSKRVPTSVLDRVERELDGPLRGGLSLRLRVNRPGAGEEVR